MTGSEPVKYNIGRRAFLALGGTCLTLAANRTLRAAAAPKARFFMLVSGGADGPEAAGWRILASELANRGFPTTLVPSIYPNASFTPNETRAAAIVTALEDADEPGVILGISNEGNVLPLVAAAHPVRRLVYVNACIPQPQKAFIEVCVSQSACRCSGKSLGQADQGRTASRPGGRAKSPIYGHLKIPHP